MVQIGKCTKIQITWGRNKALNTSGWGRWPLNKPILEKKNRYGKSIIKMKKINCLGLGSQYPWYLYKALNWHVWRLENVFRYFIKQKFFRQNLRQNFINFVRQIFFSNESLPKTSVQRNSYYCSILGKKKQRLNRHFLHEEPVEISAW